MNRIALPALLLAGIVLAGCQSSLSGDTYSREQARREMSVRQGTVEGVRAITIEGTKSNIGTAAGAAVGGLAGGQGSTAGAIAGAVVGGVAGAFIEEGATRRKGQEITIRLDTGNVIAVVQEGDEKFVIGERVRLVGASGNTRVTRAQ
ncbi:glycine zipper domain-containing protein [Methyloversatilis sp. XJ19-49]|uniref:glycine zipper domain-containing protein n=1 Tax=Methyloversatilis sp. XJ19-49 TaxID=2963429 RepID=UPI00211CB72A|nr:hypothetical protein [Methyloversatilis sp. XJ19-49]MCQ9377016.1 hypothetical protein [Methyloversatilis sp. XJ19-49]